MTWHLTSVIFVTTVQILQQFTDGSYFYLKRTRRHWDSDCCCSKNQEISIAFLAYSSDSFAPGLTTGKSSIFSRQFGWCQCDGCVCGDSWRGKNKECILCKAFSQSFFVPTSAARICRRGPKSQAAKASMVPYKYYITLQILYNARCSKTGALVWKYASKRAKCGRCARNLVLQWKRRTKDFCIAFRHPGLSSLWLSIRHVSLFFSRSND